MKKIIKRLFTPLLMLAVFITSIPIQPVAAQSRAGSNSALLEKHPEYTYEFDTSFPAPFGTNPHEKPWWTFKINQDGSGNYKTVYCIEYGVSVNDGDEYDHTDDYESLSEEQKKQLGRALIFGYNDSTGALYGGTWLDNAMATQAMVWVIAEGQYGTEWESRIADTLLRDNPTARDIYNKIRANMESYPTIPSFAATSEDQASDYELKYNMNNGRYELTLEDSNGVLKYFDFSASGLNVERNGNQLKLSTDTILDTTTLKASKNLPTEELPSLISGTPEFWLNNTQQDFTSLNVDGERESVQAYFKLHTEKVGNIRLKKTSEDGSVSGIRFHVTGNGIDNTYTTSDTGEIYIENLIAGDYTFTEEASNKYVQPESQVVTVKPGETTSVSFSNVLKKFNIYVTKTDSETGETPQGDATLDGAEYDIYNSQGEFVEHITSDGNVAVSSALPLGTYKIYETVPPTGYNLNTEPITVSGDFDGQTVEVSRIDTGISDSVIKGQIALVKFADSPLTGDTEDGGIKTPLEGVEFTITRKSTGEEVCKIVTDSDGYGISSYLPYGCYVVTETGTPDGYRSVEPFEVMVDAQGKIYKYILENSVYETDVKIVKKDSETGNTIPLTGAKFKIKDSEGNWTTQKYNYPEPTTIDTFETAEDGTLVLPEPLRAGDYQLYEVQAPYGYLLADDPIAFTVSSDNPSTLLEVECFDKPAMGKVEIQKQGERFVGADFRMTEYGKLYTPIYELQGLEGIEFDIIAAEDVTTPDGTVRYEKDSVVDTITTSSEGMAESKALYLGKYYAAEKNTQDSFVLSTEKYPFELTYKDQETEIVVNSQAVENQRQKARVSLYKEYETVCNQTYNPLSEVLFGVYAAEDILAASGDVGIEKDSLVDVFQVDTTGQGVMNTDIPAGSYYIKELATGAGYLLNQESYPFTFKYMGQEEPVISIHVNDGKPITNTLMRGDIEITKTSEDEKVEGIELKVKGTTEAGTEYEETFQTDKGGKIHIEDLLTGTYEISEVPGNQTVGYILPESQTVKVENDKTVSVVFENKLQKGGLKIEKTAEGETDLSGFEFEVSGTSLNGTEYKETFETDKDGCIEIQNLLAGDYMVTELANKKTESFALPEAQTVTVKHGEISTVKVENKKIRGSLKITKKDDEGNLLSGVKFGVFQKDGTKVAEAVTENGTCTIKDLVYGDYYLQELEGKEGYELNPDKFNFTISEDEQVIEIEVVNNKIKVVPQKEESHSETPSQTTATSQKTSSQPKTGDTAKVGVFAALLGISGITFVWYLKKKKKLKK